MRLGDEHATAGAGVLPAPREHEAVRQVARWRSQLAGGVPAELSDDDRLALLRGLEDLTRTAAAVTARVSVDFERSQVQVQASQGVPARRRGAAVADDLALTRKRSPYLSSRELACHRALVTEMPHTLHALTDGAIDAFEARVVTEATACLEPHLRAEVDERIADHLAGMSTAQLRAHVNALAYELDPRSYVERARKAHEDRGVSMRPVPDVMAVLSARLAAPVAVACYKALSERADRLRASGDERSRQQIMADELVARITGRAPAEGVDVEVGLVMSDSSLFDADTVAAFLEGYGPIPAEVARELLRAGPDEADPRSDDQDPTSGPYPTPDSTPSCPNGTRCTDFSCQLLHGEPPAEPPPAPKPPWLTPGQVRAAAAWVRRLYADPLTGRLTERDPRRRLFTGDLRAFIVSRDQYCRTPWCGAPIRHIDHKLRRVEDGQTIEDNGQGLCERCNLARERPRHLKLPIEDYLHPPPLLPGLVRVPSRDGP